MSGELIPLIAIVMALFGVALLWRLTARWRVAAARWFSRQMAKRP